MGCACEGKPSKWYFMSSCRFSFCVSICEKRCNSDFLGRMAVDEKVPRLDERGLLGQLVNRNPAVAQDSLLAVYEGDGALARAGVPVAVVQSDAAGGAAQVVMSMARFMLGPSTTAISCSLPSIPTSPLHRSCWCS